VHGLPSPTLSAPAASDALPTVVHGVNRPDGEPRIISCASCTLVKVMAWYDNEWGFTQQMIREARSIFAAPGA
jgi:glyceraldehyde-3-phosphate dehydrogenase/erythrose-4-phosphate dehydrogenase